MVPDARSVYQAVWCICFNLFVFQHHYPLRCNFAFNPGRYVQCVLLQPGLRAESTNYAMTIVFSLMLSAIFSRSSNSWYP